MTMTGFWEKIILDRWLKAGALALVPAALLAADIPVMRLGQGINSYKTHDYSTAAQQLGGLGAQIPKLADYAAYYQAAAQQLSGDADGTLRTLNVYYAKPVNSTPVAGKLDLLYARALLEQRVPPSNKKALDILQGGYKALPQPDGDFAMALAYEAQGEKLQSALAYQKVYYSYPNTPLAADASTALERLRGVMGKEFPNSPSQQQLERCRHWLDVKEYGKAKAEYAALSNSLPEPDRDLARVGMGAADYLSGDYNGALRYFKSLHLARGEAEARRLYYVVECTRKSGDDLDLMAAVKQLSDRYRESVWRLKALVSAGNKYLLTNDPDKYEPLFREASDSFPADSSTAYCHWKITWDAYLADKADRAELLKDHIERYPADSTAATAMFFLGRNYEKAGKFAEARAYYERLSTQFPHFYYGVMARERLADARVAAAKADFGIAQWLGAREWAEHRDFSSVEASDATRLRIDRARLLMAAGLADLADAELRFGAKSEGEQPHLLAIELAKSMPSPFYALRIMKSFGTDYLSLPTASAPQKFWQLLFPFPFREDVVRSANARNLDPYLVAALIRQETEFNPSAKSVANAYGLMQLIPSTGRMVGRQIGIAVPSTRTLLEPAINIQLGTQYVRSQLDGWGGDWTQTLAAYNAGPGRVREWLTWKKYREPAEFVESIPFTETREYVQAVLRNADMYRALYGDKKVSGPELKDNSDVPPVQLAALPLAARTPGGGVKTALAKPGRKKAAAKKSKKVVGKKSRVRR